MKKQKVHFLPIIGTLGLILHVPGFMALFSIIISLIFQEYFSIVPLLVVGASTLIVGNILCRLFHKPKFINLWDAMIIAALAWIVSSVICSFVYYWISFVVGNNSINVFQSFCNACFESSSGFTSTGLTMLEKPSLAPHVIQWFRSFQSWIGGMGLILFIIAIIEPKQEEYRLYYAEAKTEQIGHHISHNLRLLWLIFLAYTIFAFILFYLTKMPLWDSINHAMTCISTGGFSVSDNNMRDYSQASQIVAIFIMILGSMSFALHYRILRNRKFSDLKKNKQHVLLFSLLIFGGIFIILFNHLQMTKITYLASIFEWTSAITTCGFRIESTQSFPIMIRLFLIFGMIIGGASGSTAGGIKLRRFLSLFSAINIRIKSLIGKKEKLIIHKIEQGELNGKDLNDIDLPKTQRTAKIYSAIILFVLWIFTIAFGWFFTLSKIGADRVFDALFDVISALSNVGLTTHVVGPNMDQIEKVVYIFLMLLGRLEIVPMVVLFMSFFSFKKN